MILRISADNLHVSEHKGATTNGCSFLAPKIMKGLDNMRNIDEQIQKVQTEIEQLQNKKKRLISEQKKEERNMRTKRLIERGAILESIIGNATDFTNEQIQHLLIDIFSDNGVRAKAEKLRSELA